MKTTLLPTSNAILKQLEKMFCRQTRHRRRAIAVAFIGYDGPSLLPDLHGVEIYCWPKGLGTHPEAIRDLQNNKNATVRFIDNFHPKLYWVEGSGAVIGSANLSQNGLGSGLTELAVHVTDCDKEIASLFRQYKAKSRKVNKEELARLTLDINKTWHPEAGAKWPRRVRKAHIKSRSFSDWYNLPERPSWHLTYWEENCSPSQGTLNACAAIGRVEPYEYINVSPYVKKGAWLLTYKRSGTDHSYCAERFVWIYVEVCSKVQPNEEMYEIDYPYQAAQIIKRDELFRRRILPPFNEKKDNIKKVINDTIRNIGASSRYFKDCPASSKLIEEIAQRVGCK